MSNNNPAPAPGEGEGTTPPAPAAAAQDGGGNPPAANADEMVTVKKSDWDAMKGRQAALDKQKARLEKREQKLRSGKVFSVNQPVASDEDDEDDDDTPPATPPKKGKQSSGSQEDRKAQQGIINLALMPDYREVLDANPVLRDMLTKNPLGAVQLYASDAIDAEEAIELITEKLDEMKSKLPPKPADTQPPKPGDKKDDDTPSPITVPATIGTPVATEGLEDPQYKEALKGGRTQDVAAALRHRLSRGVKK